MRSVEGEGEREVYCRGWVRRNQSEMHGLGDKVDLGIRGEKAWVMFGESLLHSELGKRVYTPTERCTEGKGEVWGEGTSGRETPKVLSAIEKSERGL
jgi:hypothetical protein